MKYTIIVLLIFFGFFQINAQTVYSDEQVIEISEHILKLEKSDSLLRAELASIDKSMLDVTKFSSPKFVNVCGKLSGFNTSKFPINGINLQLVKENGEIIIQKTKNDGDFNFKNISTTENYTFKISEEDSKAITAAQITISDCTGKLVTTITKTSAGLFEYKMLDLEKSKLNILADEPTDLKTKQQASPIKLINVCGKIYGFSKVKFPINDINLQLVKADGEIVVQKTINNGDFNFSNIFSDENYTFKISEEDAKSIPAKQIVITDCSGKTLNTIYKNGDGLFEYKPLEIDKTHLNILTNDLDPIAKVKLLKENYKKAQDELAVSKKQLREMSLLMTTRFNSGKESKVGCDSLKFKYDALEKKYNDLTGANHHKNDTSDDEEKHQKSSENGITFNNIHFKLNDDVLDREAKHALDKIAKKLRRNKHISLMLEGHTDNSGNEVTNQLLSNSRAIAVRKYLISKGVNPIRLMCKGFSSFQPISSNDTEEGQKQNRRVEFKVIQQ